MIMLNMSLLAWLALSLLVVSEAFMGASLHTASTRNMQHSSSTAARQQLRMGVSTDSTSYATEFVSVSYA
jgi:hypothetical protein